MRWRVVPLAVASILRVSAAAGRGLLARPASVARSVTIDDVLPAPVDAVATAGGPFPIPPGVGIVTPPSVRSVGDYLADLLGGRVAPTGPIRLALDETFAPEAYGLEVDRHGVVITAAGGPGLFWGVQTLRQLLPHDGVLPGVRIIDQPRFPYRGVMLDVARHFFDVATVHRLIDLAALYKINHLHLHLTDDQGWRLAVSSWPLLAQAGGRGEVGDGPGGCYTAEDYRSIVAYAEQRFITVVPEIDLPGHTNAALAAYPALAYTGVIPRQYTGTRVGFSALHPSTVTDRFLDEVLGEVAAMTPGPYLHIGGDEALAMPAADYAAIVERAQRVVAAHGKTPVGWHELASAPLEPTTVLQFWGVTPFARGVVEAARAGHRVIMSPADRTYLDQRHHLRSGIGRTWAGPISVERAWRWDPERYLRGLPAGAVLGVEAPLWTESVRTLAEADHLLFPRLAAIAEVAWSPRPRRGPRTRRDWAAFKHRLGAQAPRLEALGVDFARVPGVPWVLAL